MKKIMAPLLFLSLGLSGCSDRSEAVPGGKNAGPPPIAVEVSAVTPAEIVQGVDVVGDLVPKYEAEVKSEVSGLVREVYVTEWVRVRKGTPLARIDTREAEAIVKKAEATVESAKASLIQSEVAAKRADRELARVRKLKEVGLATQQALDEAETETSAAAARIDAAKAQLRAAEEELQLARTRSAKGLIRSPIDGVVSSRDVNVGDLASDSGAGKTLFRIVDNRILHLTVTVPSAEMGPLRVGQPLQFTTDAIPGKVFAGKVMYINPAVNAMDRSIKVLAEVRNETGELKGGLFVNGRIVTGNRSNVISIPRGALSGWDLASKKASLFVVEGDLAKRREVVTGTVSGDRVEIVQGLQTGEKYVSRGAFNLRGGSRVMTTAGADAKS